MRRFALCLTLSLSLHLIAQTPQLRADLQAREDALAAANPIGLEQSREVSAEIETAVDHLTRLNREDMLMRFAADDSGEPPAKDERMETLEDRRARIVADHLDARNSGNVVQHDFAEQLLDDVSAEIAALAASQEDAPRSEPQRLRQMPRLMSVQAHVIRVPAQFAARAKDEAALAALLNSDAEDSEIGRGVFDYAKRLRILRLMDTLRREYADETQRLK